MSSAREKDPRRQLAIAIGLLAGAIAAIPASVLTAAEIEAITVDPAADEIEAITVDSARDEIEAIDGATRAGGLALEDVLSSAALHFPGLDALAAESLLRTARVQSARGAFDTRLGLEGELRPYGYYERETGDVSLEAPTRLWGTRFSAGYRIGDGDAASYDAGRLTDGDGEFRVGVQIPLLRGGATDRERTQIARAQIDLRSLTPEAQLTWIDLMRDASLAYWTWVAEGRRLEIAERLLAVADERQSQIDRRVRAGAEPEIDLVDNGRLIVERRALLRSAVRDFEQASLALSLFFRNAAGTPKVPARAELPASFPDERLPAENAIEADLEFATERHPLLARLRFEREGLAAELGLARNELLPALDLLIEGSQDVGEDRPGINEFGTLSGDPRASTEVVARLRVALPLQMRDARGRATAARARIARLDADTRLARERILIELRRELAGLRAAIDQTEQARENVRLASRLRDAEARRFTLGLSNLIDVNIREIQAATAARDLVDAQAAYFRSLARYIARVGRPPQLFLRDARWSTHHFIREGRGFG